jgi:putative membrane protein (TIGR04086 family)
VGLLFDNDEAKEKIYLVYLKAIIRGVILSVLLLLIAAFVFYYSSLDEKYMNSAVWIITILGICYSGIFCSYKIGSKGIFHGMFVGVIYISLLGMVALLTEQGDINFMSYIIMFSMAVIIGGLSGMIGNILGKS